MNSYTNTLFEKKDGIGKVILNRPKVLNALSTESLNELNDLLDEIKNDNEIKVVIVTGNGSKSFCAGWDIGSMQLPMSIMQARNWSELGQTVFNKIENLPQPVLAVINGFALGVGCELAMACDVRLAAQHAAFAQPEPFIGMIPGFGGTQRLARLIGQANAKELMFTCDTIDAAEAFRIGLINRVIPSDELMDQAHTMAQKIMTKAPIAVQLCKNAVNKGFDLDISSALAYEKELCAACFTTEDQLEGIRAFQEKRRAIFKGK